MRNVTRILERYECGIWGITRQNRDFLADGIPVIPPAAYTITAVWIQGNRVLAEHANAHAHVRTFPLTCASDYLSPICTFDLLMRSPAVDKITDTALPGNTRPVERQPLPADAERTLSR